MKILSMHQPWASLVACGAKRYETRSWKTDYRGSIAIHASKRWNQTLARLCYREPFRATLIDAGLKLGDGPYGKAIFGRGQRLLTFGLPFGMIVATADLVDCRKTLEVWPFDPFAPDLREMCFGDFVPGRFAWRLENVRKLAEPIRWKGCQGLRDLPHGIADSLDTVESIA